MKSAAGIIRKVLSFALSVSLTMALAVSAVPAIPAKAAAGDVPAHTKKLTVNEDGTYTLALNVTGDAEKVTQPVNTNVIVILDTSGSMDKDTGNTETSYTPSNQTDYNMYGTDGENFFRIYRRGYGRIITILLRSMAPNDIPVSAISDR